MSLSVCALLTQEVSRAVLALCSELGIEKGACPRVSLDIPKDSAHGDYASTVALSLSKVAKQNPKILATRLQSLLGNASGLLTKTEIAGPGYLNLYVSREAWCQSFARIFTEKNHFIESDVGKREGTPQRVLLEYVSANPTGPLHVAHGRGAVTGDVLARLLKAAGFHVVREYYINDLGNQTDVLARSVFIRYQELCGRTCAPYPDDFYPGFQACYCLV